MKKTIILAPDRETSERLAALIGLLFPEAMVSHAINGLDDPQKCPTLIDLGQTEVKPSSSQTGS